MRTDRYNAEIVQFAAEMARRLSENEEKQGNFEEWYPDKDTLIGLLTKNLGSTIQALKTGDVNKVSESCADMANFAMRLHQLFGRQVTVPNGRGRGE